MTLSNRAKQHTLRLLQAHLNAASLAHGAVREQAGFVELYRLPDSSLWPPYVTPRKGVALIPTRDVLVALEQIPQLTTIAGLLAPQWFRQLEEAGLDRVAEYPLLTWGAIPDCDQETPTFSTDLHDQTPILEAKHPAAIEFWLRLHQITPTHDEIEHSLKASRAGHESYLLAADEDRLVGAIMLTIQPPVAQLHGLYVSESHRQKGIGAALIQAAIAQARARNCTLIFTVSDFRIGLYKKQGFVNLDSVVVYRKPNYHEQPLVQFVSSL